MASAGFTKEQMEAARAFQGQLRSGELSDGKFKGGKKGKSVSSMGSNPANISTRPSAIGQKFNGMQSNVSSMHGPPPVSQRNYGNNNLNPEPRKLQSRILGPGALGHLFPNEERKDAAQIVVSGGPLPLGQPPKVAQSPSTVTKEKKSLEPVKTSKILEPQSQSRGRGQNQAQVQAKAQTKAQVPVQIPTELPSVPSSEIKKGTSVFETWTMLRKGRTAPVTLDYEEGEVISDDDDDDTQDVEYGTAKLPNTTQGKQTPTRPKTITKLRPEAPGFVPLAPSTKHSPDSTEISSKGPDVSTPRDNLIGPVIEELQSQVAGLESSLFTPTGPSEGHLITVTPLSFTDGSFQVGQTKGQVTLKTPGTLNLSATVPVGTHNGQGNVPRTVASRYMEPLESPSEQSRSAQVPIKGLANSQWAK